MAVTARVPAQKEAVEIWSSALCACLVYKTPAATRRRSAASAPAAPSSPARTWPPTCCAPHAPPRPSLSLLPQEFATDRVIVSFKPDVVRAMAAEEEGLQFQKPAGLQVNAGWAGRLGGTSAAAGAAGGRCGEQLQRAGSFCKAMAG